MPILHARSAALHQIRRHKTKHTGMQHHKCRQGLREEATSCTGRKEKATDPRAQESTPTHIPFPTRFSKRRHVPKLNRALVVHTPLRIKWQQPRQIMPPITRIYEASVALSSRLSDLGSSTREPDSQQPGTEIGVAGVSGPCFFFFDVSSVSGPIFYRFLGL